MLFKRKIVLETFVSRLKIFDGIDDYNQLLKKQLKIEPHTVFNTTHALNFFKISHNHINALSIGIDPIKEWSLINENLFEKITVYDIDKKMILKGNTFWKSRNIPISYKFSDILNDRIELGIYDYLILFQMDYIFSDSELKTILMKAKSAGISGILVITPSIFNLGFTKNLNILFHEIGSLILYLYGGIKSLLFSKSENKNILTYRRTYSHFTRIFNKAGFKIKQEKTYINPNGSFNFFHFSNKN